MHGVRVEIPAESLSSDQVISLKVYGGEGPLLPPHQIPLSPFVTLGVAGSEPGQVIHRISFDSKELISSIVIKNYMFGLGLQKTGPHGDSSLYKL